MPELVSSGFLNVGRMSLCTSNVKIVATSEARVSIGSFCTIGENFKVLTLNHDWNYPALQGTFYQRFFNRKHPGESVLPTRERTKGDVTIGSDVWIGDDVTILSGVSIGDGCCIGASSIVTQSIPSYTVAAGVPCKPIRRRFPDDIVALLEKLRWWDWDDEKISKNKVFFETNLSTLRVEEIAAILK
jgi:acetyltransferase-like isoleucine patch superfamily enzyme